MSTDSWAALGGLFILAGALIALATFVFCVVAVVDVLRRPAAQWAQAGQNQVLWIALLIGSWFVGLPFIAAVAYWLIARPALKAAEHPYLAR